MAKEKAPKPKKNLTARISSFARAICNWEKKEFIGRTASSWAKIGLFYLVYYGCLAGFFAIMMLGLFSTMSDTAPTMQNMYSLIKLNPGMGFRPMLSIESTLIKFNGSDPETYKIHIESIKSILKEYQVQNASNVIDCSVANKSGDEVCYFGLDNLGTQCTEEHDFGYKYGKPCVLLKMNKVYNFMPAPFDNDTQNQDAMKRQEECKNIVGDRYNEEYIGISCQGENAGDEDNLRSSQYYPNLGYSYKYFPYLNQPNYQAPLVFVQFPNVNIGTAIQIWCKLWAKNIKHHKNDRAGSVHFELLVDKIVPTVVKNITM